MRLAKAIMSGVAFYVVATLLLALINLRFEIDEYGEFLGTPNALALMFSCVHAINLYRMDRRRQRAAEQRPKVGANVAGGL